MALALHKLEMLKKEQEVSHEKNRSVDLIIIDHPRFYLWRAEEEAWGHTSKKLLFSCTCMQAARNR